VFESGGGDSFFELEASLLVVSSADFLLTSLEYLFGSMVLKHLDCLFRHSLCVGRILGKGLLVEAGELKQAEVGVDVLAPSI
jgi:hypothetical protein